MSDSKIQAIEPDPAATTISNDETINKPSGDTSAPSLEDSAMTGTDGVKTEDTKSEGTTDTKTEVKEEGTDIEPNKKDEQSDTGNEKRFDKADRGRDGRGGRGRGGKEWVDYGAQRRAAKKNNRFDPTALPETGDAGQIRAQVEFYFSDSNLPGDKFLWQLTDGASNRPVPVQTIHNFKRMQRFQPYTAVIDALKSSPVLVLEGEEGSETIKRKTAYDPEVRDNKTPRSVYVKGFGAEEPTSQFDIEAFFTNYGPTRSVRLRRHESGEDAGLFKGSAFCEFQNEETAENFLKAVAEKKPTWKGEDSLKIMSKAAYIDEKNQLIKDGKMQPNEAKERFFAGRSYRPGARREGDRNEQDWRKRRDNDQKDGFRSNGRGNGRGRGRGRGGRGGRGGRDNRDTNDRPHNTSQKAENNIEVKAGAADTESNSKRPREDDDNTGEAPAKKQDIKTE